MQGYEKTLKRNFASSSGENLTLGTLARPSWKRMNVEIELPLPGERLC